MLARGLNSSLRTFLPPLFLFLCVSSLDASAASSPQPVAEPSNPQITDLQTRAQQGDPDAELALAKAYEDGRGVRQDDSLAVKWYRAAAEQGNATAQNNLGLMYRSGRGVEKSKEEAVQWYRKAAKQKNASAMFNLGTAYYNGDGVLIDDVEAYAWFLVAKESGSTPAVDAVGRMNSDFGSRETDALEKVGDMYQKGDELPQSNDEAIAWYRKAAPTSSGSAQVKLASLLIQSHSGSDTYAEVRNLCDRAAKLQYPQGAFCMALLYERGMGVAQDTKQAAQWYSTAANLGHATAMLRLGQMYWNGDGVRQDKISAYEYVLLASTAEIPEAKQEMEMFEKGMDRKQIEKARAKAFEWTRQHHLLMLRNRTPGPN